jgi:hypothetical protein
MDARSLPRRHPIPALATTAFAASSVVTVIYFAGVVPGVGRHLPTFVRLVAATGVLFAVAAMAWVGAVLG